MDTGKGLSPAADALHQRAAYYSSKQIIRKVEAFAREHKAWWIIPIVVILLLVAVLIVSVSAISPFIYSLF